MLARVLPAPRLAAPAGRLALAALSLLGAFAFYSPVATREWLWPAAPTLWWEKNRANARMALYLREQTPPGTSVALHAAGTTGYFVQRPTVDVLGKSDRHIAKLPVQFFHPGHSKWDWDYVLLERQPDVIVDTSRGLESHPALAQRYFLRESPGRPPVPRAQGPRRGAARSQPGVLRLPLPQGPRLADAPSRSPPRRRTRHDKSLTRVRADAARGRDVASNP